VREGKEGAGPRGGGNREEERWGRRIGGTALTSHRFDGINQHEMGSIRIGRWRDRRKPISGCRLPAQVKKKEWKTTKRGEMEVKKKRNLRVSQ
jgi:hypothetical protein